MNEIDDNFDVIVVGGSYAGLAAAMALGRSMRQVLVIDNGKPCNRQTPHSHNFLTQDGKTPKEIASLAKQQVDEYATVQFFNGTATHGAKTPEGFEIRVASGERFRAKKLIFATGIRDILPAIDGMAACWGISVLHCPYCHGYEVRNEKTGILANGEAAFDFSRLISNWTKDLTLYTNEKATLTPDQIRMLAKQRISIDEAPIEKVAHTEGYIEKVIFKDGRSTPVNVLYTVNPFEQHCLIPESMGCELSDEGYLKVDPMQKTSLDGVYACGDSTTRVRTIANAVAMGTTAGMMVNKEFVLEKF